MLEKSQIKKDVFTELQNWNYMTQKASIFNIAMKLDVSPSSVQKVLQFYKGIGAVINKKGSWRLV